MWETFKNYLELKKDKLPRMSSANIAGLKDKLKKAFESNCESNAIRLTSSERNGDDVIAITKSKFGRLMKAYEANKGMTIKMSRGQLAYTMKIEKRIFTNAGRIDSIHNRNCFACIMSWGFIRTGKNRCSKTNRNWVVS